MVNLANAAAGRYTLVVRGMHLPSANASQPYALVLSASLAHRVVWPCNQRPCVQNCSSHGSCTARGCMCSVGWSGSSCNEAVLQPHFDDQVAVSLQPLRWKYVRVVAESPIRQLWLRIDWNQTRMHQYAAVYMAYNRMPTAADFDFADMSVNHDVAWEMANARQGDFFVGIYAGCCSEIQMKLTIKSAGYTRAGQWRVLPNGVPRRIQLTKEDWRFFKVEPVSAAQISLKLMMIGELVSDADLYASTIDWPSFLSFEYKSTNAGSDAIDIASASVLYVGVVGFGRSAGPCSLNGWG